MTTTPSPAPSPAPSGSKGLATALIGLASLATGGPVMAAVLDIASGLAAFAPWVWDALAGHAAVTDDQALAAAIRAKLATRDALDEAEAAIAARLAGMPK